MTSKVQPGSIVLFHNAALHTPEALPAILTYLINDGYCETFAELMNEIDKYGLGRHGTRPECKDCMLHSGYEASAVRDIFGTWGGMFRAAKHMRNFNKKTQ